MTNIYLISAIVFFVFMCIFFLAWITNYKETNRLADEMTGLLGENARLKIENGKYKTIIDNK